MSETTKPAPLVVILGDGGIRAGFTAGAADAVMRKSATARARLTYLSGISASAASVLYYIAFGDKHPGQKIWTSMLGNRRFLHYERLRDLYRARPLYDLEYLVEVLFKQGFPFDQDKVRASPITFYIPMQSAESPAITYVTNGPSGTVLRGNATVRIKNAKSLDLYQVIKAASAAPFVYDRTVPIDGDAFMDAATLEPFALDLPGYENAKFIIFLNAAESSLATKLRYVLPTLLYICFVFPFRKRRFKLHKYFQYAAKPFRRDRLLQQVRALEKAGRAVLVVPERNLGALLDPQPETLGRTYRYGQRMALKNLARIEKMLST